MFFILLFFSLGREVELPGYSDCTVMGFSKDKTLWIGDDKSGVIYEISSEGSIETLGYGLGSGPGEFYKPLYILSFEKKETLLLICRDGMINTYHSDNGEFIKKISGYMIHEGALKWDDEHFLMIWASSSYSKDGGNYFRLFDLQGNEVDSWKVNAPQWQKEYIYDVSRGNALGPDKTVFMGDMAAPELYVFKYREKSHSKWKIKPPITYLEPPKNKLSQHDMFNKEKLNAYISSFTYITDVVMSDDNLIIIWRHPKNTFKGEEPLFTYDVYDSLSRKPITLGNSIKGLPRGVANSMMVSMHRFEEENTHLLFENLVLGAAK